MGGLVVFESMFGNAWVVARAVAAGLRMRMPVEVLEVGTAATVIDADLLVVGGPNHRFGLSSPESRREAAEQAPAGLVSSGIGLREWLAEVEPGRAPVVAAAYDTRLERPRFLQRVDRSARLIEKRLQARGFRTISTPRSFYVLDITGPLRPGERVRAFQWGKDLSALFAAVEDAASAGGIAEAGPALD